MIGGNGLYAGKEMDWARGELLFLDNTVGF